MIRKSCIRGLRALGVVLLALTLLPGGNALAAQAPEIADPDRQVPFALAVRGGVSLGAYESGFEWALLKYLKDARANNRPADQSYVDLLAASGASAGSINALMSTLSWCIDPTRPRAAELFPDTVSDNLLFDTWLSIGFEELLPEKVDSFKHYRADDVPRQHRPASPAAGNRQLHSRLRGEFRGPRDAGRSGRKGVRRRPRSKPAFRDSPAAARRPAGLSPVHGLPRG